MGTVIKSLYKEYFQKSRVFLYPALGIRRGVSVTPIETYMGWDGKFSVEDRKLCCLYHLRDDEDFRQFEKNKLLGNPLFFDFKQVKDKKAVYVFDFNQMANDWDAVVKGKYSKLSQKHKTIIRNYIGLTSPQLPYIDSFLYPERYFKLYAEMIGVEEELLKSVGELCSLPNFELEILNTSVENLELRFN
jgi:hypothetical protein